MASGVGKFLRHPIMVMVVLVVLCRAVKNAYPFNSFPMYADPSEQPSNYLIVADGAGQPLDVKQHTGLSSAKVKKIYTQRLNNLCDKLDLEAAAAPPEVLQKAFALTLQQLREAAQKRSRPLPAKVRVTEVLIYQEDARFREEPRVLGEG